MVDEKQNIARHGHKITGDDPMKWVYWNTLECINALSSLPQIDTSYDIENDFNPIQLTFNCPVSCDNKNSF